ncbi:hypothetical protein Gogos_021181 [Gossypium gossypioides]|uniref:DUF7745 domain-containing protein n=1 Tax=Gossypium gossypioides TaxID=34282 RepID=A0A7J9D682_GOSGO|nr:hypothetical protein [Gossypium gossypioides]
MEDNVVVRVWSEKMQLEKGDSLTEGCFTFGEVDLVPTIDEYTVLLRCPRIQADKVYSKAVNGAGVDQAVIDLFDRLDRRVTLVPAILAETFRYLSACRSADEDVEWKAPWKVPNEILYRCGDFNWVPLLGIWGAVGYAPLLEAQMRNEALEKSLSESRSEKGELKARVDELEESLHHYQNYNTAVELRASLSKIEEMKRRIEELDVALQSCEMRIEFFEANEERPKEQLHFLLAGGNDKGKGPMANAEEGDNDGLPYPAGFTPPHVQTQAEVHPCKSSVTIKP